VFPLAGSIGGKDNPSSTAPMLDGSLAIQEKINENIGNISQRIDIRSETGALATAAAIARRMQTVREIMIWSATLKQRMRI
jgi:hypothetical protein